MIKRILGRAGIKVSEVSLGTASIGFPYGLEKKDEGDCISESDAIEFLRCALDRGINFFDSSCIYGCSEERVGKAFKGVRGDVVICTKGCHLYDKDFKLLNDKELAESIEKDFQQSLSALQTDHVDIYMVHINAKADPAVMTSEIIADKFSELKRKGMTRAIGISTYTVEETKKTIESGIWDVIQLPYNLMDQTQEQLFDLAVEKGVGIVVRSVLFKGILTDKVLNLHPKLRSVQEHREVYNDILSPQVPTLSDLATKFVLSKKAISSVLVGTASIKNLDKALSAANGEYLDNETLAKLSELAYPDPDFLDLAKWFQAGWTS